MPEKMRFAEVIESQGVPFIAHIKGKGGYVDGEWVSDAEVATETVGIILPLTEDILNFVENGTYTNKEKKLLTTTSLAEGTRCEYKSEFYTVEAFKDFSDYTDVFIYVMRWRKK
ncbi:hypothetical protein AAGS61_05925 [Lysinibacillus sp. KU-BSD001]|uniref:hypothetical protein n=1 Tax=Lysinibacillus sp. KU-BSD001 TaxID=3141328 RepID=UPI0036EDE4F6